MKLDKIVNLIYKEYVNTGNPEKEKEVKMAKNRQKRLLIINAADDKVFWTAEGRTIKNLYQLSAAFEQMSNEAFKHHVNESKNDFSTWVYDIFGEKRLAKRLTNAKTKQEAQIAVLKQLVSASSK